ncbi:MAG: hypothetical protein KAQ84_03265 [Thermoplasmatales archaeon]|nr:hypothetical protein [Thermoplasmatales archaeon]
MKKEKGNYFGVSIPEKLMQEIGKIVDNDDSVYRTRNNFVRIAIREKIIRDTGQLFGKRAKSYRMFDDLQGDNTGTAALQMIISLQQKLIEKNEKKEKK